MLEFRKKKKIRKVIYSPIILILLFLLFVILAKGVWGVYQKEKLSAFNLKKEKIELERLQKREKTLASSIDYLKTDQGVENEIRTKFRAVKENEKVAVIIDEEATTTSTSTPVKRSFWYRLFH
jgi:cell division protein FtsB